MSVAGAEITMADSIRLALRDAMAADQRVIAFGEDLGDREGGGVLGITKGLSTEFGDSRVRSTPISEQAIVGAAIGASLAGLRPVAEIMLMNFMTVAMDMITNHAAKLRFMSGGQTGVPIVIRTMTGSGFGTGGQHSDFLEAWFAHTPGLKVVLPSSPSDAYGLLLSCIDDEDPCIFIEPMSLYFKKGAPPERNKRIPLGQANVLRSGSDVTAIAYGPQVGEVLAAAQSLAGEIDVEVIDLRTVSPIDEATIFASVAKTGRAVITHEAVKAFGVGAEVAQRLSERLFATLQAPVLRLGAKFAPVPFSRPLELAYPPNRQTIEAALRQTFHFGKQ